MVQKPEGLQGTKKNAMLKTRLNYTQSQHVGYRPDSNRKREFFQPANERLTMKIVPFGVVRLVVLRKIVWTKYALATQFTQFLYKGFAQTTNPPDVAGTKPML